MRKWLALLAVGIIALLITYRAVRTPDYLNLPPSAAGPWIAFGDSLTEGFGASEGHAYPVLLGSKLGVQILNHGVSGETTGDALARLENVAALRPQVVLLCLGGNDTLRGMSQSQAEANLRTMIDRFHQGGSFVVLIGIRSAALRDHNAAMFERLAKDKKVLLIPNMLDGVVFSPSLMSDTIHPNDAGYEYIAERLAGILQPLLPKLQRP